jgi:hypothetical protein
MHFQVLDYQNVSRIGFFDIIYLPIHVPNATLVEPNDDGSGFILYMPKWGSGERVQFLVDDISISSDFPANFSSLAYYPISYKTPYETWSFEFRGVLTVIGKTFFGTYSIASLHQFTNNRITQPVEKRIQTTEYSEFFFVFLYFFALLFPLSIWSQRMWRRLPFVTLALFLLMVFLYAFIGSGREIYAMEPYAWDFFKIWPFGSLMHVNDDHIFGNLSSFIPLSMLLEVWLNVKANRRRFGIWYIFPIISVMLLPGIGFSIANEFLAWALWSLIIVEQKTGTRPNLLLCICSGVMANTFFGWLFAYLPYIFSSKDSLWSETARMHIILGFIGAAVFAAITIVELKRLKDLNTRKGSKQLNVRD